MQLHHQIFYALGSLPGTWKNEHWAQIKLALELKVQAEERENKIGIFKEFIITYALAGTVWDNESSITDKIKWVFQGNLMQTSYIHRSEKKKS